MRAKNIILALLISAELAGVARAVPVIVGVGEYGLRKTEVKDMMDVVHEEHPNLVTGVSRVKRRRPEKPRV